MENAIEEEQEKIATILKNIGNIKDVMSEVLKEMYEDRNLRNVVFEKEPSINDDYRKFLASH